MPGRISLLLGIPFLAFLGALSIAYTVNSDAAPSRPAPSATASVDVVTAPLGSVEINRESCSDIRGTDYLSGTEQQWFLANCITTPAPERRASRAPNPPAVPGTEVAGERWVLIDIAKQEATAMVGDRPLYSALATTGKAGWETPTGTYSIVRRVANETMTSASIGAEEFYVLKDVLYTQYFTNVGHAIHLNYWRPDYYFGEVPSSHGCIGLRQADAEFFWRFATNGTRVTIR